LENAGKIPYLDAMSWGDLSNMVDDIFSVLHSEFKASGQFRSALSRAVNRAKARTDKEDWEGIEWTTVSDFVVHQATFKTKKKVNDVANGFEGEVQIRARMPRDVMDWKKMETKAPPNLVHSQDATVVHEMLTGGHKFVSDTTGKEEVFEYSPMVTVHDSFSVLPDDAYNVLRGLEFITMATYRNDPLVQFGRSVIGNDINVRSDRSYRLGDNPYS
jgi:DNA-directed RNA polymerase